MSKNTCPGTFLQIATVIGSQELGKPAPEPSAELVQHFADLALTMDPVFCAEHCLDCGASKGEVNISRIYSKAVKRAEGDPRSKARKAEELLDTDQRLSCPFLIDPSPYDNIAYELDRGVDPKVLEEIGLGSEPSPLGGTLASDIDPEVILDRAS